MARSTSNRYGFQPAVTDLFIDAFERIQIYGPALTDSRYLISARRSANLILADYANRGFNLWVVGDEIMGIPLQPGVLSYTLPRNVVDLADCYLRTYTPNSATTTIGNQIAPMLMNGKPAITSAGEPIIAGSASGTLSCVAGSQYVTLKWPAHCLSPGDPIFWTMPASIGTLCLQNMSIVDSVPDSDHVTVLASAVAPLTSQDMGATPLYAVSVGVPLVGCILPNHGLCVGDTWTVHVQTDLGGIEVSPGNFVGGISIAPGNYTVEYVSSNYEFYFNPTVYPTVFLLSDLGQILTDGNGDPLVKATGGPAANDAKFENNGFLVVTSQSPGLDYTDIYLWPLSRNEYAMLPNKVQQGRPTQYWFNRTIVPSITMWPVPPAPVQNATVVSSLNAETPAPGPFFGFVAYRMRTIQDADPVDGEAPDIPTRFYLAFVAELAAAMAEKFKPEQFEEKLKIADMLWQRAAGADTERVSTYISPQLAGFFS